MINVIAAIRVKPECFDEFIDIFKTNIANVKQEQGCIEYRPTIDIAANLAPQSLDSHVVTVIEKWESLDALHAHLQAAHMLRYKEQVKEMVVELTLKVLQDV